MPLSSIRRTINCINLFVNNFALQFSACLERTGDFAYHLLTFLPNWLRAYFVDVITSDCKYWLINASTVPQNATCIRNKTYSFVFIACYFEWKCFFRSLGSFRKETCFVNTKDFIENNSFSCLMDMRENKEFKGEKLCDGLTNYLCLLTQIFSHAILLQTYI